MNLFANNGCSPVLLLSTLTKYINHQSVTFNVMGMVALSLIVTNPFMSQ